MNLVMRIHRIWIKRRVRKKRKKAIRKIEAAVHAFKYLNRTMIKAGISRQIRKQLRRDLVSTDDPDPILDRFLQEIKKLEIPVEVKKEKIG